MRNDRTTPDVLPERLTGSDLSNKRGDRDWRLWIYMPTGLDRDITLKLSGQESRPLVMRQRISCSHSHELRTLT